VPIYVPADPTRKSGCAFAHSHAKRNENNCAESLEMKDRPEKVIQITSMSSADLALRGQHCDVHDHQRDVARIILFFNQLHGFVWFGPAYNDPGNISPN